MQVGGSPDPNLRERHPGCGGPGVPDSIGGRRPGYKEQTSRAPDPDVRWRSPEGPGQRWHRPPWWREEGARWGEGAPGQGLAGAGAPSVWRRGWRRPRGWGSRQDLRTRGVSVAAHRGGPGLRAADRGDAARLGGGGAPGGRPGCRVGPEEGAEPTAGLPDAAPGDGAPSGSRARERGGRPPARQARRTPAAAQGRERPGAAGRGGRTGGGVTGPPAEQNRFRFSVFSGRCSGLSCALLAGDARTRRARISLAHESTSGVIFLPFLE